MTGKEFRKKVGPLKEIPDETKIDEELERQKRAATDLLHGINELDGLTTEVNKILTGAGVPQLGA